MTVPRLVAPRLSAHPGNPLARPIIHQHRFARHLRDLPGKLPAEMQILRRRHLHIDVLAHNGDRAIPAARTRRIDHRVNMCIPIPRVAGHFPISRKTETNLPLGDRLRQRQKKILRSPRSTIAASPMVAASNTHSEISAKACR